MALIQIVIALAVIGVLLWLLLTYVPMAQPFPKLITGVVVVCVVLWLLNVFGVLPGIFDVHIGRIR